MVKLCVKNDLEISMLEWMLKKKDIQYRLIVDAPDCGLDYPYLVVDGVPLDEERAMTWVRGKNENE